MKSGRPIAGDVPLDTIVTFKVSQEENQELEKFVKLAHLSKSEVIRIALSSVLKHVKKGFIESNREVKKLIAQRRFSMEAVRAMLDRQEQQLNQELNAFAYQANAKNAEAKQKKKEKTDSPSEE